MKIIQPENDVTATAVYSASSVPIIAQSISDPNINNYDGSTTVNPSAPPTAQPYFSRNPEQQAREYLTGQRWPSGLQDTFIKNLSKIAKRFFICDDSGSMVSTDGHKLVEMNGVKKLVSCSRWSELTEALKFHATISKAACAPSEFRLLNGGAPIIVGTNDEGEEARFQALLNLFDNSPSGTTPLCHHIGQVISQIRGMESQLRASGQKACVIIATDGESSDGDIANAMRPLQTLPVWVVVRLCTDDEKVVDYWNNIDSQLELDMDVLDDLCGEAEEVMENNNWLTYGEPMHRLREFGIPIKEIDLLDETTLSISQIRYFCTLIFGGDLSRFPEPEFDFKGFIAAVNRENRLHSKVWHPIDKVPRDWINVRRLYRLRPATALCAPGGSGCNIS